MEKEKLMLGDWVFHKQSNAPVKVYSLDDEKGINDDSGFTDNDYEPIPLTEDIIKLNGFDYDYDDDECVGEGQFITMKGYILHGDIEGDSYLVDYCNGKVRIVTEFHGEITKNMQYVHELQQALRLCGLTELADKIKVA